MFSIDILTLFPNMVNSFFSESILARGQKRGHFSINTHQIRDYTQNKQKQVDDYPYGGGLGMIMQADPLFRCWEDIVKTRGSGYTIFLTPCGSVFSQNKARYLVENHQHLILVCGHYEGIDQRFIDECVDEEISIGDYVLTGGELAACVLADAVCRLIPGVLADEASFAEESHWEGLLEYPHYSRPEIWHERRVPEILLSGNHGKIAKWRKEQSIERTKIRRPDLWRRKEIE